MDNNELLKRGIRRPDEASSKSYSVLIQELLDILRKSSGGKKINLAPCGSVVNKCCTEGSDLDLVAYEETCEGKPKPNPEMGKDDQIKLLKAIQKALGQSKYKDIEFINANVPLLKWSKGPIDFDISCSWTSVRNSNLLRRYALNQRMIGGSICDGDSGGGQLLIALSNYFLHWLKGNNLNKTMNGGMNSYSAVLMTVFFMLQQNYITHINEQDELFNTDEFESNPEYVLLNPYFSNIDRISKLLSDMFIFYLRAFDGKRPEYVVNIRTNKLESGIDLRWNQGIPVAEPYNIGDIESTFVTRHYAKWDKIFKLMKDYVVFQFCREIPMIERLTGCDRNALLEKPMEKPMETTMETPLEKPKTKSNKSEKYEMWLNPDELMKFMKCTTDDLKRMYVVSLLNHLTKEYRKCYRILKTKKSKTQYPITIANDEEVHMTNNSSTKDDGLENCLVYISTEKKEKKLFIITKQTPSAEWLSSEVGVILGDTVKLKVYPDLTEFNVIDPNEQVQMEVLGYIGEYIQDREFITTTIDNLDKGIFINFLEFIANPRNRGINWDTILPVGTVVDERVVKLFNDVIETYKIAAIQGPPGTAKTYFIHILIKLLMMGKIDSDEKAIILAQKNDAIIASVEGFMKITYPTTEVARTKLTTDLVVVGNSRKFRGTKGEMFILENVAKRLPSYVQKKEQLINNIKDKIKLEDRLENLLKQAKAEALQKAKIIMCTIHSIHKLKMTYSKSCDETRAKNGSNTKGKELNVKYIFVDEAGSVAQTSTTNILSLNSQYLVLVGDQKQLPPYTVLGPDEIGEYNKSLLERINEFEPIPQLSIQYRMHPKIAKMISRLFYNNKLVSHVSMKENRKEKVPLWWINVKTEEGRTCHSFHNMGEVKAIISLLSWFKRNRPKKRIMVITFYSEQLEKLLNSIFKDEWFIKYVIIRSVDSSQGREADIVIVSCVRSNLDGSLGFIGNENRMCVALSRAREMMIIVGNIRTMKSKEEWRIVHEYCQKLEWEEGLNLDFNGTTTDEDVTTTEIEYQLDDEEEFPPLNVERTNVDLTSSSDTTGQGKCIKICQHDTDEKKESPPMDTFTIKSTETSSCVADDITRTTLNLTFSDKKKALLYLKENEEFYVSRCADLINSHQSNKMKLSDLAERLGLVKRQEALMEFLQKNKKTFNLDDDKNEPSVVLRHPNTTSISAKCRVITENECQEATTRESVGFGNLNVSISTPTSPPLSTTNATVPITTSLFNRNRDESDTTLTNSNDFNKKPSSKSSNIPLRHGNHNHIQQVTTTTINNTPNLVKPVYPVRPTSTIQKKNN